MYQCKSGQEVKEKVLQALAKPAEAWTFEDFCAEITWDNEGYVTYLYGFDEFREPVGEAVEAQKIRAELLARVPAVLIQGFTRGSRP